MWNTKKNAHRKELMVNTTRSTSDTGEKCQVFFVPLKCQFMPIWKRSALAAGVTAISGEP